MHLLGEIYIVILYCIISQMFRFRSSRKQGDQIQGNLYVSVRWKARHVHLSYIRYSSIKYSASAACRTCVALFSVVVHIYINSLVYCLPGDGLI